MTLTFETDDQATNWALGWLRQHGWSARLAETPWVQLGRFRRQLGLSPSEFHHRLHHPDCPVFESERGQRRILRLRPTPELVEFLTKPNHKPSLPSIPHVRCPHTPEL